MEEFSSVKKKHHDLFSCGQLLVTAAYFLRSAVLDVGVSKNRGTTKSSILIGFSIINHPFWGTPIFGNIHVTSLGVANRRVFSFKNGCGNDDIHMSR